MDDQDAATVTESERRETPPEWGDATWTDLADAGLGVVPGGSRGADSNRAADERATRPLGSRVLALLPVGAVEAHGPHLPLVTDVVIARAAAAAALPGLRSLGFHPLLLPPLAYTAAPFAAGFPGTISVRPATFTALLADVAASLEGQGVAALVVVNAHLDPAHLAAIGDGVRAHATRVAGPAHADGSPKPAPGAPPAGDGAMPVVHPDITERRWASRLTDEFRSGACHAGRYETSVVMAAAPELVRDAARQGLAANPASLSRAIRDGAATFEDAGVSDAYCGDPAAATREEGENTVAALAAIVVDAVVERLGAAREGTR
ncbi:MAG: creatininase family protein [Gemmatimonadetes bacterium]|nr:creatininase family protein [Gemmatimonadota bacterium]